MKELYSAPAADMVEVIAEDVIMASVVINENESADE